MTMKIEELWSNADAAKLLGISPRTLLVWKHRIGFYKIGQRIYFRFSDLEAFVQAQYIPPFQKELQQKREQLIALLKKIVGG
jgi:excisionase family DNA binding protein